MFEKFFGSKDNQKYIMVNENRHITRGKLPVEGGVLIDNKKLKSWFQNRELLEKVEGSKEFNLILDVGDAFPKSPYYQYSDKEITNMTDLEDLAAQGEQDEIAKVQSRSDQNRLAAVLDFGIISMMVLVVIFALLMLAGKMDFSNFMGG